MFSIAFQRRCEDIAVCGNFEFRGGGVGTARPHRLCCERVEWTHHDGLEHACMDDARLDDTCMGVHISDQELIVLDSLDQTELQCNESMDRASGSDFRQ